MATIKDIAKKAGVSISTVSYALNGVPKVNAETRERILAIAKEIDYHPNSLARNLKTGSTHRIAVFMNELSGAYIHSIMKGIQDNLVLYDFDLLAATVHPSHRERSYGLLRERWLDGAILINSANINADLLNTVSEVLPLVLMDREPNTTLLSTQRICTMIVDNYRGAFDITKTVADAGRTKFLFLGGDPDSFDNKKRFEGFNEVLKQYKIHFDRSSYLECGYKTNLAYQKTKAYLKNGRVVDAIICANDEMALGAMHAITEMGFKIPEEIAVTGFDDIEFAEYSNPPLSTVSYDRLGMGSTAVHVLMDMLQGKSEGKSIIIPTRLMIRGSSGNQGPSPDSL